MKLRLLFSMIIATIASGCGEVCDEIVCLNGGDCNEGQCICPEGYSGASCELDACYGVVCFNDGECVDGECQCPNGYEGDDCQTLAVKKFVGNYQASGTEMCAGSGIIGLNDASIQIGLYNGTRAYIYFYNNIQYHYMVAEASGNTLFNFIGYPGFDASVYDGTATLNGNTLTFNYSRETDTSNCDYSLTAVE
jgi:hypothetical protein